MILPTCWRDLKELILIVFNWLWKHSHNWHMVDLKVRLDSVSNSISNFFQLLKSSSLNHVLYLSFFTVKLIQRVFWIGVCLLWKVHFLSAILMMNSLGSSHCQGVSIVVHVFIRFFEHWKNVLWFTFSDLREVSSFLGLRKLVKDVITYHFLTSMK